MQLRIAGFGANQLVHTTDIEELTQHLPIRIEFVEVSAQVDQLLPTLYDMVSDGLSEVQDTMVVKAAIKERNTEPKLPHAKQHGKAKLMRIYLGEADPWKGEPLYEAIVKQLRRLEISGATVHRGILGYGATVHAYKQSFWHLSRDRPGQRQRHNHILGHGKLRLPPAHACRQI